MPENIFSKAKADGQVFVKTMALAGKLSKLKLEITKRKREKERLLKAIGAKIVSLYEETQKMESQVIFDAVQSDLHAAQDIDHAVIRLEAEMEQVKADFRTSSGGAEPPEVNTPPAEGESKPQS